MYQLINLSVSVTQAAQPSDLQRKAVMLMSDITAILPVGTSAFYASYDDAVTAGFTGTDLVALEAFFSECTNNGVTVLSVNTGATGVSDFTTWLTAHRSSAYNVLVPIAWYSLSEFATLLTTYKGNTDKIYFFVLVTDFTTSGYSTSKWVTNALSLKDCLGIIQNPSYTSERPDAAAFGIAASYGNFSTSSMMTPIRCTESQSQTAYDVSSTLQSLLKSNNLNWFDSSKATSGIDAVILAGGTYGNGKSYSYWYGIDWCQCNLPIVLNGVLQNGANDKSNPIFYNQNGIDRLVAAATKILNDAVSFQLISDFKVTATAFSDLSDATVASGVYSGLAIQIRVQNEFTQLNVAVNFTELAIS